MLNNSYHQVVTVWSAITPRAGGEKDIGIAINR